MWVPRQIGPVHSASWRAPGTGSLWDGQGPSRSLSRLTQGHHAMAHPSTILWKAPRAVELTCVPAFSMGIGSDAPSALVDYLMDLAPRIIEWRSTDCSTSHPQSKTSKRTCHPQFRNGVITRFKTRHNQCSRNFCYAVVKPFGNTGLIRVGAFSFRD